MRRADSVEPPLTQEAMGKPRLSPSTHCAPRNLRSRSLPGLGEVLLAKVIDPRSLRLRCHAHVSTAIRRCYPKPGGPQSLWVCGRVITVIIFLQHGSGIIRSAGFHNPFGLWRRDNDYHQSDFGRPSLPT